MRAMSKEQGAAAEAGTGAGADAGARARAGAGYDLINIRSYSSIETTVDD